LLAAGIILLVVPLLIALGMAVLDDRKYYFISLLIIIFAMIPFVMIFESRRPQAREIVIIAMLAALAIAGRSLAFMLPGFKPVIALVIITGVCLGGEAGFLVGVITGFVSNFFFGQGPWTPWQMFCFGIIGFLAGILFRQGRLSSRRMSLCWFGGLSALLLYGGIMDTANVLIYQGHLTRGLLLASYASGFGFNVVHALSTVFFLWLLAEPMIEKLERVKTKYGLLEDNKRKGDES
jgi:energy-coupling factor transport system substrate-specific component